jgi:uracil-DNA glycosylase
MSDKGFLYNSIFIDNQEHEIFKTWIPHFKEFEDTILFLSERLEKRMNNSKYNDIYPEKHNVLRPFFLTPYEDVKCIIWGQDPYPTLIEIDKKKVPRAQGLSFSVHEKDVIPFSLKNIFKNIKSCYGEENFTEPEDGDISYLAKEGVLLLNMCPVYLSYFNSSINKEVEEKKLKKEYSIFIESWSILSRAIVSILNKKVFCIHVFWGNHAKGLIPYVKDRHCKLESGHPSPLAGGAKDKFMDNKHFIKINLHLKEKNIKEINWNNPKYDDNKKTYIKNINKKNLS